MSDQTDDAVAAKHKRDEALAKLKAVSRRQEARISHLEREVESLRAALARLVPTPVSAAGPISVARSIDAAGEAVEPNASDGEQRAAPSADPAAATPAAPSPAATAATPAGPQTAPGTAAAATAGPETTATETDARPASAPPAAAPAPPAAGDPFAEAETAIRELQRVLAKRDGSPPDHDGAPPDLPESGPRPLQAVLDTEPETNPGAEPETTTETTPEAQPAAQPEREQPADTIEDERPVPAQPPRPWWRIF